MSQKTGRLSSTAILPSVTGDRIYNSRYSDAESSVSGYSFKQWHRRMQENHLNANRIDFSLWKWCDKGCKPCRWFDNIDYDVKICKCCLKFRTFKSIGTLILSVFFTYVFMYAHLNSEVLPGGTIFFMFVLFVASYTAGFLLMLAGLPLMFGNLLVGIIFGNLPKEWLPNYDEKLLSTFAGFIERFLLIIAIIRAGLLLDFSRIKGRVKFIVRLAFFPLIVEFGLIWVASRLLLRLPWEWASLQGSVLCIVSLSSVTSVMEKNKQLGYGEDKHLSTVLIAAAAIEVVVGIFTYIICISCLFPAGGIGTYSFWDVMKEMSIETAVGLSLGSFFGLLVAFFPDKRNPEAAALRIFVIGAGAVSLASILAYFHMPAAGVLGALTLCLLARNMWEELGWHEDSNPVQYFYSMVHYFGQPVALSMVGFSIRFDKTEPEEVGMAIAVITIGLLGREIVCFSSTFGQFYPTTMKEKIFICIAWFSKGTFQALLALVVEYLVRESLDLVPPSDLAKYLEYARIIKHTTILAILLTTPLACYTLTLVTPILLTKAEHHLEVVT